MLFFFLARKGPPKGKPMRQKDGTKVWPLGIELAGCRASDWAIRLIKPDLEPLVDNLLQTGTGRRTLIATSVIMDLNVGRS